MSIVSKFKTAAVAGGIALSALGGLGAAGAVREARAAEALGLQDSSSRKDSEFAITADGDFLFMGTTLIALGWRRGKEKKPSWKR